MSVKLLRLSTLVPVFAFLLTACTTGDELIKRTRCSSCAVTNRSPSVDLNKLRMQPPYSGAVLWQKLQKLVGARGGFITADEVESAFGEPLTDIRYLGPKRILSSNRDYGASLPFALPSNATYVVYYGRLVVGGSVINPGGVMTRFLINWPFQSRTSPQCIPADLAIKDLMAMGWRPVPYQRPPAWVEFVAQNVAALDNLRTQSHITLLYGADYRNPRDVIDPGVSCVFNVKIDGRLP